jgi:type I restriction enzyme S subunit
MKTINLQPISENAKVISGFAFKSSEFMDIGIPVVKITNVKKVSVALEDCQFVDRKYLSLNEKYKISNGDVLIALTGSHLSQPNSVVGRVARYHYEETALLNQRVGKFIIHDKNNLDLIFLYYYLVQDKILYSLALNAKGSANQANISPSDVERILIPAFTLSSQRVIADSLCAYDDLIDTNHRRIQLLEEAARLLFREWFIYFRFPGHEKVKIVDGVPEGWEKVPFPELIDFKEGPGLRNYQFREEGIPFLNIRTFGDDEIDLSKVGYLDENEVYSKYKHFLLKEDDHVISSSGTLGRLVTVRTSHLPLMLNTSLIRMRPKKPMRKWMLKTYLLYGGFIEKTSSLAIGAAQLNFGPAHLNKMTILFPKNSETVNEFEKLISEIYLAKKNLLDQNQKLAQARDLLLPRLMSGEIDLLRYDKLSNEVEV